MIFIDTSAFLALVHRADTSHQNAVEQWEKLLEADDALITNNYVLVESIAIAQSRYGLEAVIYLQSELLQSVTIDWMDTEKHASAIEAVLLANRRNLSLVDCSSFQTMKRLGIDTVFTFDKHFREQGFNIIP